MSKDGNSRRVSIPLFGALSSALLGLYLLVVRGALTIDLGWGRRLRPLGPILVHVQAPRELVFQIISAPYLDRTPRALEGKLHVVERGQDMVLAAHYTRVHGLLTTTLETVKFTAPERVDFRLVRGPVPHVIESFLLHVDDGGTELEYRGELGTDLWWLGEAWGRRVAAAWEGAVRISLEGVRVEAERRSQRHHTTP